MRRRSLAAFALCLALAPANASAVRAPAALADSIAYVSLVSSTNQVGLSLTNYGFFGNNFVTRDPSFEYPLGSGYEHMARGGLWIGAHGHDLSGDFTGVTTAALDGNQGSQPSAGTEFTPAGNAFTIRAANALSPYYSPGAVSDFDMDCAYSDRPARAGSPEPHRPLDLLVRQSVYAWNWTSLGSALLARFAVSALGDTLRDVWVGIYSELASGNKNAYSCWPPASICSPPGGWYGKKWLQYDASQRLVREHYCKAQPVPDACQLADVPAWAGIQLLTPPGPGQAVTLTGWSWSAGDPSRDQDVERYALMSAGTIVDLTQPQFMPGTGDPVELLALGPFAKIAPGDSIVVEFAFLGGADVPSIQAHGAAAQAVRDANYDAATPALASLYEAHVDDAGAHLVWRGAGAGQNAVVERRTADAAWREVGRRVADGAGAIAWDDPDVAPGGRYGWRLVMEGLALGEVWLDVPRAPSFALDAARPNPLARGALVASFTLAGPAAAQVELLDVAGRRAGRSVTLAGAGRHAVALGDAASLAPGLYVIRLTQGERVAVTRCVVTR